MPWTISIAHCGTWKKVLSQLLPERRVGDEDQASRFQAFPLESPHFLIAQTNTQLPDLSLSNQLSNELSKPPIPSSNHLGSPGKGRLYLKGTKTTWSTIPIWPRGSLLTHVVSFMSIYPIVFPTINPHTLHNNRESTILRDKHNNYKLPSNSNQLEFKQTHTIAMLVHLASSTCKYAV